MRNASATGQRRDAYAPVMSAVAHGGPRIMTRVGPMALLLSLIASVVALHPSSALACVCARAPGYAVSYDAADVVFVGTVASIAKEVVPWEFGEGRTMQLHRVWATFAVDEGFKGVDGSNCVVTPGEEESDCSLPMAVGERWLIFAHRSADAHTLVAGRCSGSIGLAGHGGTAAYYRVRAQMGKEPSVVGSISETVPTGEATRTRVGAVAGVTVTLSRGDDVYSAVTDRDGGFVVDQMPAGTYAIHASLPHGYRIETFRTGRPDDPSSIAEGGERVTVGTSTCFADFETTSSAGIDGRFVDANGKPVEGLNIALVGPEVLATGRPDHFYGLATTDEDGRFAIEPLAPCKLVVAVNCMKVGRDLEKPPGPSFVVGDATSRAPKVFEIEAGVRTAIGTHIVPMPACATVRVAVVDSDGKPVAATIMCYDESGLAIGLLETDGEAKTMYLEVTRRFVISAHTDGEQVVSESVVVGAPGEGKDVTLVVR